MRKYIVNHWFGICVVLILILGTFLRFYDYKDRYGLAYDQAHDALVARGSIHKHKLPVMGPFSSAGPFVMGPEWYYFIILGTLIYYHSILTPWIILTTAYIISIYFMILIGKKLAGRQLGLILGIITAVSTVQISQAINLTNQAPLSILAMIAIWGILKYLETKKIFFLALASLCVGIGVNTHLQGVLLIPLIFLTLIFQKPSFKGLIYCIAALFLPFIPLVYFDFTHNHYEMKNMIQYYLHDQYKIPLEQLGRSWKSYLAVFWPNAVSEMIGGFKQISYLLFILSLVFGLQAIIKKGFSKFTFILLGTFLIALVFLRYTHTPLFSSYLMFINPFIFIIFGWALNKMMKVNLILGIILFGIVIAGSMIMDLKQMQNSQNYTATQAKKWVKVLEKKYPNQKFAIYDYGYHTALQSLALSLLLDADSRIDNDGRRIGVSILSTKFPYQDLPTLLGSPHEMGYQMFDLQSSTSAQLVGGYGWVFVNPDNIYENTEEWYK